MWRDNDSPQAECSFDILRVRKGEGATISYKTNGEVSCQGQANVAIKEDQLSQLRSSPRS